MSERGSFITEYIYCPECFEQAKKVLLMQEKYLCSQILDSWSSGNITMPIIAGKIGGLYCGEELDTFIGELIPAIEALICHSMRIAVLAETGERIFFLVPAEEQKT